MDSASVQSCVISSSIGAMHSPMTASAVPHQGRPTPQAHQIDDTFIPDFTRLTIRRRHS
ncbi:MAG: hypothetical protein AAGA75_06170 [Cyanobacteria bacterium P01_E01_bin.6]